MAALRANAAIDGGGIVVFVCRRRRRTAMMAMEEISETFDYSGEPGSRYIVLFHRDPLGQNGNYQTLRQTKAWFVLLNLFFNFYAPSCPAGPETAG